MDNFLICYGAENEFWLCLAEDKAHAIEQFVSAEMVSADPDENEGAINQVFLCVEVA